MEKNADCCGLYAFRKILFGSQRVNTLLHQGGLRALILLIYSAHIAVIAVVIYVILHKVGFVGVVCVVVLAYVCAFVCVRN